MRLTRDLVPWFMFGGFGLGAAIVASGQGFSSPTRMGPGYFPIVVGVLPPAMGLALVFQEGDRSQRREGNADSS